MTHSTSIYRLEDIRHFYGDKKVLDIPELKIEPGSITGILGPNGSGKSTLLKLLGFIEKPTFGTVYYHGRPEYPFSASVRSKVTLLTQKPYLLKRNVLENVIYGLKIRRDTKNIETRVKQALDIVDLDFDNFSRRSWHELSGGEAQRVALAARLILEPDVLLLDEPIASVDSKSAGMIRQAVFKARERLGTTLVIVSHDTQWLYSISDVQLSVYHGSIFFTGLENIINGPFRNHQKFVVKPMADGAGIFLKPPQDKEKNVAVIRKKDITLDLEKQADHPLLNQIEGQIVSMMSEKKTEFVLTGVSCGDLSFLIRLTMDQIRHMELHPGKAVILKFKAHAVIWT